MFKRRAKRCEKCEHLAAEVARLNLELQHARAHLMMLRIDNHPPKKGAVGWRVMVFIPEDALIKLRGKPLHIIHDFVRVVADALVDTAIKGFESDTEREARKVLT